jgi:hypothetical protein
MYKPVSYKMGTGISTQGDVCVCARVRVLAVYRSVLLTLFSVPWATGKEKQNKTNIKDPFRYIL